MFICSRCKRDVATEGLFCPFCGAPAPQADGEPGDPYIGQTVAQKYFVHQLLGRGGMGQVYKATHLTLDRPVVLKMLNHALSADPAVVQRFHREARAASRLNHPNSINVMDFGQAEDGTLYMAMEYLSGRSLARVVVEDFPLDPARVIRIGAQILAALAEAHAVGILHRDLKPENVMVEARRDDPDFVKVLDFGIAQLNDRSAPGGPRLTQAGMVCGTPGYMSPEQARGEELDARSDLYAVGIVLYEMLTGKLPFDGDTPQSLVAKVMVEDPIPVRQRRPDLRAPPPLEELVMRALSPDREGRPASADEFRRELLACMTPDAPARRATPSPHATMVLGGQGLSSVTPRSRAPNPSPTLRGPLSVSSKPAPRVATTPHRGPTPASLKVRSTPRPVSQPVPVDLEADEEDEEDEERRPAPRAAGPRPSRLPLVLGSLGAVAALAAVAAWAVVGSRHETLPSTAPVIATQPVVPPSPPATQPRDPPGTAKVDTPPVEPARVAPPHEPVVAARSPAIEARPHRAHSPRVSRNVVLEVGESLNSIATPSAASGEGVLTIDARPWAEISIDGHKLHETPVEVRVPAGTYRISADHPELGHAEERITVAPGQRARWIPTLAQ